MSCLSHEMTQITYDVSQHAGHSDFSEYSQYCAELDIDTSKLKLIVPSGNGEICMWHIGNDKDVNTLNDDKIGQIQQQTTTT